MRSFLFLCLVSGPRSQDPNLKRNGVKVPSGHRRKENGVSDRFYHGVAALETLHLVQCTWFFSGLLRMGFFFFLKVILDFFL